jgi:hypothetical protein
MPEPWDTSLETQNMPAAQGVGMPEGSSSSSAKGEEREQPAGWIDHGAAYEDGPVTWEALTSPRSNTRRHGEPVTILRRACVHEHMHSSAKKSARLAG